MLFWLAVKTCVSQKQADVQESALVQTLNILQPEICVSCGPLWSLALLSRVAGPRGMLPRAGQPAGLPPGGGRLSSACVLPAAAGEPRAVVRRLCLDDCRLHQTAPVLASWCWP